MKQFMATETLESVAMDIIGIQIRTKEETGSSW